MPSSVSNMKIIRVKIITAKIRLIEIIILIKICPCSTVSLQMTNCVSTVKFRFDAEIRLDYNFYYTFLLNAF